MAHRGKLDGNDALIDFANKLEQTCIEVVESGRMTKDLALLIHGDKLQKSDYLNTEDFLDAIDKGLQAKLV